MGGSRSDRVHATITAVVLGLAGILAIAVWSSILVAVAGVDGGPERFLLGTIAIGPAAASVVAFYLVGAGRGLDYLDLRWPGRVDVGYALGGAATLLAVNVVASLALDRLGIDPASHDLVSAVQSDPGILLALMPLAYLSVGLGEELLYRNVIQKSLYDVFSRRAAVVVASVVFAAVHFSAFAGRADALSAVVVSLVLVFVLSLVLGIVYERTGNLLVPTFAHGTFDAAVYAILYAELVGVPA